MKILRRCRREIKCLRLGSFGFKREKRGNFESFLNFGRKGFKQRNEIIKNGLASPFGDGNSMHCLPNCLVK